MLYDLITIKIGCCKKKVWFAQKSPLWSTLHSKYQNFPNQCSCNNLGLNPSTVTLPYKQHSTSTRYRIVPQKTNCYSNRPESDKELVQSANGGDDNIDPKFGALSFFLGRLMELKLTYSKQSASMTGIAKHNFLGVLTHFCGNKKVRMRGVDYLSSKIQCS